MRRPLAMLCAAALVGTTGAQCFQALDQDHGLLGAGDDVLLPMQAIGFVFPFAGAAYTHVHVSTNGFLYLSNAGTPAPGNAIGDAGGTFATAASQRTTLLGGAPKLLPFYRDLDLPAAAGAGVWFRAGTTGPAAEPCVVTWVGAVDWNGLLPAKTFQCQLHPSGIVEFHYAPSTQVLGAAPATVGVSPGGGLADPGGSDLGNSPATTSAALYEQFPTGGFDLQGRTLRLQPAAPGWSATAATCQVGTHTPRGAGCYGDSFYQWFDSAAAAAAGLAGHALRLVPHAAGYTAHWEPFGAWVYSNPFAATDLPRSDDGQALLDLAANGIPSLPLPGGSTSTLWIHMNGFVSTSGPANDDGAWNSPANDFVPTPAFRNAPETAFWAWHDWDPSDLAGGPVRWHYDAFASRLYVTWDGVENWSVPPRANPGTFQFQFDLANGSVRYLWLAVDNDTTSPYGSGHLVGFSPGGASADPGSLPLATAGSTTTITGQSALGLHAAPPPVVLAGGGSSPVTYTIDHVPDYAPPNGVRLGILFFAATAAPGLDLGLIGAPSCQSYLGGLDVPLPFSAIGGTTTTIPVAFPPPLPAGTTFHAQAVALFPAGALPGGLNAFGLVTSNGLATTF
ncbi:MAG: hypothetical protein KF830_09590 [Planctomycetes bacterium]|nr:hypothetical protein [Planctomycetota bacterium]